MELRPPPSPTPPSSGRSIRLMILLHGLTYAGTAAVIALLLSWSPTRSDPSGENIRTVASKLKAAGALNQAAAAYERYLDTATTHRQEDRTKIAYSLATLYLDQGQYERALRWLYEADLTGPGDLQPEISRKIVHCLERLGRVHAAQAALSSRVALEKSEANRPADDPVVARVGAHHILLSDVQRAIDDMPPQLAGQFAEPSQREAFLRKLVADELIARKAAKLEFDKDPAFRRRMEMVYRQLLVDTFVEKEIVGKVSLSDADLRTYFEANRQRYDRPAAIRLRRIEVASEATARNLKARLNDGAPFADLAMAHSLDAATREQGGLLPDWVSSNSRVVSDGTPSPWRAALFAAARGAIIGPQQIEGRYYLFRVEDKRPAQTSTFDRVRANVAQDYRRFKVQSEYQALVDEQLSAENVKLFPERLTSAK